ncbi:MAG: hypothetical protein JW774_11895 [Candidatus Aureabacteria bacterium]|nr:hypothetical protein [Candidatus Auribacterota bacterium]
MHEGIGLYLYNQFPLKGEGWEETVKSFVSKNPEVPFIFWEKIPSGLFLSGRVSPLNYPDDKGRGLLLGLLFKIMNRIAPFTVFWIVYFLALPVLLWLLLELNQLNHAFTAWVFIALFSLSSYVSGAITLTYSSTAFYLLAGVMLFPFLLYCFWGRISFQGYLLRLIFAGMFFAVCAICRSGALFLLPGFMAGILTVSADQVIRQKWAGVFFLKKGSYLTAVFAGLIIFLAPYGITQAFIHGLMNRTNRIHGVSNPVLTRHAIWHSVWAGLGDFDSQYGHIWGDLEPCSAVARAGGPDFTGLPRHIIPFMINDDYERILRKICLKDIMNDPFWYGSIMGKRLLFTVFLVKLLPWEIRDGSAFCYEEDSKKTAVDLYYQFSPTADFFKIGWHHYEWPVEMFMLPVWILLAGKAWKSRNNKIIFRYALFLFSMVIPFLILPVFLTTAGGMEPQAVIFLYFLGFSFALEKLIRINKDREIPG